MKHKGPIITLAAGLIVAAVLMVLNLNIKSINDKAAANDAADTNAALAPTTPPPATVTAPATSAPPAVVQPPAGAQITFAGNVSGGGGAATLAIAVKDGKAIAYLCDGKTAEAWMQGTAANGLLDLSGAGDAKLTGTYAAASADGNVTAVGKQFAFSLAPVAPPSGLYRASADVRNAKLVGGWIVLANGKQVGLATVGGKTVAVAPLDTTTGRTTVDGTTVTATAVDGTGL